MRNIALVLMIFFACTVSGCAQQKQTADYTASAKDFVSQLSKGDFTAAEESLDSQMKAAAPPERLKEIWDSLAAQYGPFDGQVGTRKDKLAGYDVVYVTCQFDKSKTDLKIVFDSEGRISGLWNVPTPSECALKPPSYIKPERFREQDITVGSGEWKLPGTLTIPVGQGPFPAVVLVHGSGPNDRDETIGPNKPFRDIAQGLASQGIAVLRYDKRTKVYPGGFASTKKFTVKEETIDDALAAISLLRNTKGINTGRIYVLGHSLGGILIPKVGKADPKIAGLIMMAGCGTQPLEDVVLRQLTYIASLNGPVTADTKKEIDKEVQSFIKSAPASYLLDLRHYIPAAAAMAKSLKQPILIMQGKRDYQSTTADFNIWKAKLSSRTNVTFKLYPDLNHLFIAGSGKITPQEYGVPGYVSEEVIDDIAAWIKR